MKIDFKRQFFFHPFTKQQPKNQKKLAVVTFVALTLLSGGIYLMIFAAVNLWDRKIKLNSTPSHPVQQVVSQISPFSKEPLISSQNSSIPSTYLPTQSPLSPKLLHLKERHHEQFLEFKKWANEQDWKQFDPLYHHYDWWAFPIDRPSVTYGEEYAFSLEEIELLKKDEAFMEEYRATIHLVLKAWGWDLINDREIIEKGQDQHWKGYGVRLGKLASSLKLFKEDHLFQKVRQFAKSVKSDYKLENWVLETLELN